MKYQYQELIIPFEEVRESIEFWAEILGLLDWTISIEYVRFPRMDGGKVATCTWVAQNKTASIKMLDPGDYKVACPEEWPYDMEQVLVHEMLHISFAMITEWAPDDQVSDILLEQAVDQQARALIAAYRTGLLEGSEDDSAVGSLESPVGESVGSAGDIPGE